MVASRLNGTWGRWSAGFIVVALWLARNVWRGASGLASARVGCGGALLVVTLSAADALANFSPNGHGAGGLMGRVLADSLRTHLNVSGSYLALGLAAVGTLALMMWRSPAEMLSIATRALRPKSDLGEKASELDNGQPPRLVVRHADAAPKKPATDKPPEPAETLRRDSARRKESFPLPALSLLDPVPSDRVRADEASLEWSARVLEEKLSDFGVSGRVVEVQPGPVVTMFKFEPGSGIKVSQIVNLADDLSLTLRAAAVRIQAPVPGEAVVGIEVPNRHRQQVFLREILEAAEFHSAPGQLTVALGKDIAGRPVAADLARMPHLLIAGATGTGKSVSVHAIIASILFNATADDVRFILIDPKMLELSVYEGTPHLLVPVVVDPEKAASALLWATQEMENRYRLMRALGVRNIDGYNRALESSTPLVELGPASRVPDDEDNAAVDDAPPPLEHRHLFKIVIVIDEFADLLLCEGKTVERDVTRLAQKARAAGIHLVLATQRPSVDVITGLIKANLPARISFQVTSRVDSRTILDAIGAERLLGLGDMLFMPPGTAKLVRLHGPFVSEAEIRRLTGFLRSLGTPEYRMEILETKPRADEVGADAENFQDELYEQAVEIVTQTNQASISMIQRRLRIGYNRAARMVEQMEREGLVTAGDGARPRELRKLPLRN